MIFIQLGRRQTKYHCRTKQLSMRHKEDARLVEGERKHLLRKTFIIVKREYIERGREKREKMLLPRKTFCHRKLISYKGHMN